MSELTHVSTPLKPDLIRIHLLGSQVFIPLRGEERLGGWIALGNHRSGETYVPKEIRYLEALAEQASIALERAQVVGKSGRSGCSR